MLAERAEDDTDATVLEHYEQLRRALGVGTVNLVYRHLATLPGALPAAVATARRLRRDGWLTLGNDALRDLAARLPAPPGTAGLDPRELAAAQQVLEVYADANPRNYVVLRSLGTAPPAGTRPGAAPPATGATLPPAPPLDTLDPGTVERGRALADGLGLDGRLFPTLHRHLGVHPQVHAALVDALRLGGGTEALLRHTDHFRAVVDRRWGARGAEREASGEVAEVWRTFEPAIASHSVLGHLWLAVVREIRAAR